MASRLQGSFERLLPRKLQELREARWLAQHAESLAHELESCRTIDERFERVQNHRLFRSNQKRGEFLPLLRELESMQPSCLCEIGADRGGTLALLASVAVPRAKILSVDLNYPASRARAYRRLARNGRTITCLEGDSHSTTILNAVKRWVGTTQLDFLFIDGDHSLAGVRADHENYGSLVRAGGLIAFHDIVPDFRTRYGQPTPNDVGEVPAYWASLSKSEANCLELIEDRNQDGYGIGVLRIAPSTGANKLGTNAS